MDTVLAPVFIILLIAFAVWQHKNDLKRYGRPTKEDRVKTYISSIIWFIGLLVIFHFSGWAYMIIAACIFLITQITGAGSGKRGWFRQIRDGGVVGLVATAPICLIWINQT